MTEDKDKLLEELDKAEERRKKEKREAAEKAAKEFEDERKALQDDIKRKDTAIAEFRKQEIALEERKGQA